MPQKPQYTPHKNSQPLDKPLSSHKQKFIQKYIQEKNIEQPLDQDQKPQWTNLANKPACGVSSRRASQEGLADPRNSQRFGNSPLKSYTRHAKEANIYNLMREDDTKSQGKRSSFAKEPSDIFNREYRPLAPPREPTELVQKFNFSQERTVQNSHYRSAAKVQGPSGANSGNIGNLKSHQGQDKRLEKLMNSTAKVEHMQKNKSVFNKELPKDEFNSPKKGKSMTRLAQAYITARTITPQLVPQEAESVLIQESFKKNKFQQSLLSQKHRLGSTSKSTTNLIRHDPDASCQENQSLTQSLSKRFSNRVVTGFGENGCLSPSRAEASQSFQSGKKTTGNKNISSIACIPTSTTNMKEERLSFGKKKYDNSQVFSPVKHYSGAELMRMEPQSLKQKFTSSTKPESKQQQRIRAPYISQKPVKGGSNKSTQNVICGSNDLTVNYAAHQISKAQMPGEKGPGMGVAGMFSPKKTIADSDLRSGKARGSNNFSGLKSSVIGSELREEGRRASSKGRGAAARDHFKTNWI